MAGGEEEDGHDFEVLLACPRGLDAQELSVDFGAAYDRQPHPQASLEDAIEEVWQRKKEHNPSLYNGTKFRYAGFQVLKAAPAPGSPGPAELALRDKQVDFQAGTPKDASRVCLRLGLSDYRTFAGTNLSQEWRSFLGEGASDVERCRHLGDPLGNAALVRTGDGKVLLLQRGDQVGEFPNHPVFPGGHSEPVEVGVKSHGDVLYSEERQQLNTLIALEMFAGIVREVEEETGAPAETLSNVKFLGLVRRKSNARPVAMFACECSLSAAEVEAKYANAEHKFESTKLRAAALDELHHESQGMPGCHKGGCALGLAFLERHGIINVKRG